MAIEAQMQTLREGIDRDAQGHKELQQRAFDLQEQKSAVSMELQAQTQACSLAEERYAGVCKQLEQLQQDWGCSETEVNALKSELEQTKATLANVESDLEETKARHKALAEEKVVALEANMERLGEENREISAELKEETAQKCRLELQVAHLDNNLAYITFYNNILPGCLCICDLLTSQSINLLLTNITLITTSCR